MMTSLGRIIGNRHLIVRMRIQTDSTELMEFFRILTEQRFSMCVRPRPRPGQRRNAGRVLSTSISL